ncbi:hypothetical protein KR52_09865 [Synechococcus sp. KORDI-52]|uniref:hypothetical protein n=1 Tax=Synechococcus sp. KORDI-52 TaxID=585425 RepID=UPI0004E048E3|nr:hypothetical protein [Synechococcus sp. KORDI-52]AII49445.1 hypothetical protein KR52_09865 [Synechococcus sp. KORDI-52]
MTDQITSWDPALLRKFSTTGHFRLLNQLKGDLRKKPLERDQRSGQLKSLAANRGSSHRSTPSRLPDPAIKMAAPPVKEEQPRTFRDRLGAIEMR